jgi:superfamily I DNA and RNA helicase
MKNVVKALFEAKKQIGKISRDSTNPFFKSKYFDINTLLEQVEPILGEHGLLLMQPLEDGKVKTVITHVESGEQAISTIDLGESDDPQKVGSAITYYRRYTLQSLLALQAEDDDGNKASGKTTPPDKKEWLNKDTDKWDEAIKFLSNGGTFEQIQKKYKISKENKESLMQSAI